MTTWKWDSRKNLANQRKHRLSFEKAKQVFDDPFLLSRLDSYETEERWQSIGTVDSAILVVVHTWQVTTTGGVEVRIISARKATRHERKSYEEGAFQAEAENRGGRYGGPRGHGG